MEFNIIINNLENIHEEMDYVIDKISKERYDLSTKERENIFLKHIELATSFGFFENVLKKVIFQK